MQVEGDVAMIVISTNSTGPGYLRVLKRELGITGTGD